MKQAIGLPGGVLLLLLLAASLIVDGCQKKTATMILHGGNIITMNEQPSRVSAIALRGDRILAVGDREGVAELSGPDCEVIDLAGKTVVPGLIDAHLHLAGLGRALSEMNVVGTQSLDQILKMVKARADSLPPGAWITGGGWDQNDWPIKAWPTRWDLDKVVPHNPVLLRRIDGHAVWVNSKALALAGMTSETPDPEGGRIIRARGSREPSGVLIDEAMSLVRGVIPETDDATLRQYVAVGINACLKNGLTSVHDAGADLQTLGVYKEMIAEGKFPLRVYAMIDGSDSATWQHFLEHGPLVDHGNGHLTVRSIKLFADGALGSRGAALLEPYDDEPGNRGLVSLDTASVRVVLREARAHGFQVNTHAIGDRGNRLVLDLYEKAMAGHSGIDHRWRIEHAQVLAPGDIPRFHQLGVVPAMQPTHCTSDMYWAVERIGTERARGAYAWRALLDSGVRIAGGSDAPVEKVNPFDGIYAAVTRQDQQGWPEEGWYPDQRVTRMEALRMFTIDAAYAAFEESTKGSLAAGKRADLVVIDRDILAVPASDIPGTQVVMTIVGGRIVYPGRED